MNPDDPRDAAPRGQAARRRDHSVPLFEGRDSRRHVRRSLWRLRLEAALAAWRSRPELEDARTLVQFAGWPRSGHSLIGALIDAHPEAVIAHELDAMGLFHKGVPARRLPLHCAGNAARFTASGRHWNGFAYAVPEAPHGPRGRPRVVGDKKGDWATRWAAADPDLTCRLAAESPFTCRWILVTRHPADNIATMSLRRGGAYDRLRISGADDVSGGIRRAQAAGEVASEIDDGVLADYRALTAAVAQMKARVPAENWIEIVYERFAAAPEAELERLAAWLGLSADPEWRDAAAAMVRSGGGRSRDRLSWRDDQRQAVAGMIAANDFFEVYRDEI